MDNKILVAYTTKYGATSSIAKKIGEAFELVQYAHSDINVSSSIIQESTHLRIHYLTSFNRMTFLP